jgi:uncharacterized protein (TIGR02145 family)
MKKIAVLFIPSMLLVSFCALGQMRQKIGSNDTNIAASATLEIESTTTGFLPTRMTYLQRNAIVSPAAGLIVWCTNCSAGELQVYNGTSWTNLIGGAASAPITVATPTYQGVSVISSTGIGYNGVAVPAASTITVQVTTTQATPYNLSATHAGTGLIYSASGQFVAAGTFAVVLQNNGAVIPNTTYGTITLPLIGANNALNLAPRIDIKSIPASATEIVDVVYGTQIWMDRNLGAQRKATSKADVLSYGNFYQWGRPSDGHEIYTYNGSSVTTNRSLNSTTSTRVSTISPTHGNFIITTANDWTSITTNPNRWATNSQGPCPTGYHVPTQAELNIARAYGAGITNSDTAFSSDLKLPSSGVLGNTDGLEYDEGTKGYYWSSSVGTILTNTSSYWDFTATGNSLTEGGSRARGRNVRCIKN